MSKKVSFSIILNDYNDSQFNLYGVQSWLIQNYDYKYEIIVNNFGEKSNEKKYTTLAKNNKNCTLKIFTYDKPKIKNTAAFNNIGFHKSSNGYIIFTDPDIIVPSNTLSRFHKEMKGRFYSRANKYIVTKYLFDEEKSPSNFNFKDNFDTWFLDINREDLNLIPWGTWIVKREQFEHISGYDANILYVHDRDFDMRFSYYLQFNCPGMSMNLFPDNYYGYQVVNSVNPRANPMMELMIKKVDERGESMQEYFFVNEDEVNTDLNSLESLKAALYKEEFLENDEEPNVL